MAFRHILTSAAQPTDAFSLQKWLHLNNNIRFISKKLCCDQKIIDQKQIYSFIYLLFMTTQAASPVAINYVWSCLVWEWKRRVKRATRETRTSATTQRCKCGDKDEHGGVAGMRVKEGGGMGEEEDGNEQGEDSAEDKAARDKESLGPNWTRDRWMRTFWHRQRHHTRLPSFTIFMSLFNNLTPSLQRSCRPFRGIFTLIRLSLDHPVERLFNVSRKTLSAAFPDTVLCAHIFLVLLEKVSVCCWFAEGNIPTVKLQMAVFIESVRSTHFKMVNSKTANSKSNSLSCTLKDTWFLLSHSSHTFIRTHSSFWESCMNHKTTVQPGICFDCRLLQLPAHAQHPVCRVC